MVMPPASDQPGLPATPLGALAATACHTHPITVLNQGKPQQLPAARDGRL